MAGALCGALAVLLGLGSVSCAGRLPFPGGEEAVSQETKEKLSGIQALIEKEYIGEVDEDALQTGICQGYVGALGDPYSAYYDEEQTSALMETTQGEYGGIGVVLTQNLDTGITTASSVYEDSPAMKAGMKDGDIIYQVEGRDVSGMIWRRSPEISGREGTTVEITVLRGEDREEVTLTITRDTIQAETVKTRMLEDEIGYLAISEFDSVTLEQYKEGLAELKAQGMEGLIVDLRGNPGGNLDTVCEILDLMLPEGLIVYTEDKDGNRQELLLMKHRKYRFRWQSWWTEQRQRLGDLRRSYPGLWDRPDRRDEDLRERGGADHL